MDQAKCIVTNSTNLEYNSEGVSNLMPWMVQNVQLLMVDALIISDIVRYLPFNCHLLFEASCRSVSHLSLEYFHVDHQTLF